MSQLSYSVNHAAAFKGMKADSGDHDDVVTGENTAEAIPFGHFTALGAAGDDSIKLPSVAADITDIKKNVGVAIHHHAIESSESGVPQYPVKSAVNAMKKGRVWVYTESAVTKGVSEVHVRYVGDKGAFRGAAVVDETAILAGAKWLTSTVGAGLAILEIDVK